MAVPQRRTSKTVKRKRRSHERLQMPNLSACSNCGEMIKPHRVCKNCGFYKKEEIISKDAK